MRSTDRAWNHWGETEPYFGVLSTPEFRKERLADNVGEFFASGERFIADRCGKADRLYGSLASGSALDYGCGVGRLVIPLCRRFGQVTGVDISSAMRRECGRNLVDRQISNAELSTPDDLASIARQSFDFVNSYIVLQHIPVHRGMVIIDRLLDLTAPGGVINVQVVTARPQSRLQSATYWAQRTIPGIQELTNLGKGRSLREPLVEMNPYPLADLLNLFLQKGFGEVTIDVEMQGRMPSAQLMAQRLSV